MKRFSLVLLILFVSLVSFAKEWASQCYSSDLYQIAKIARDAGAPPSYKVNFDKGFFDQIIFTLETSKRETSTGKNFTTSWQGQIVQSRFVCKEMSGQAYTEGPCRFCIEF